MKYYKIATKDYYEDRIASYADFTNNIEEGILKKIGYGEIIAETCVFDYFYLSSYDKEEFWEWCLFDIHKFYGKAGWLTPNLLISEKLKKKLELYNIAEPHSYYKSNLIYKNEKFEYYIFQFTGKQIYKELTKYINFSKSEFLNPAIESLVSFENIDDYIVRSEKLYFEKDIDFIKKKIALNNELDFFPMQSFLGDNIVSERLKQAIEENGITGFEFSELNYEVVVEAQHR